MGTCNDDKWVGGEQCIAGVNGELGGLSHWRGLNSATSHVQQRIILHRHCVGTVCKSTKRLNNL